MPSRAEGVFLFFPRQNSVFSGETRYSPADRLHTGFYKEGALLHFAQVFRRPQQCVFDYFTTTAIGERSAEVLVQLRSCPAAAVPSG